MDGRASLVFFGVFVIVPMFGVLFLSFTNWNGLGARLGPEQATGR